jgi:hypothetical protein
MRREDRPMNRIVTAFLLVSAAYLLGAAAAAAPLDETAPQGNEDHALT